MITDTSPSVLIPFGLLKSDREDGIFGGEFLRVVKEIRSLYPQVLFDHRPLFKDYAKLETISSKGFMSEEFRRGYAAFKYAVSKIIQPRAIFEVGIGSGVSALAFLVAAPNALYFGLDNRSTLEPIENYPFFEHLKQLLLEKSFSFELIEGDSQERDELPLLFDLVHLNGPKEPCQVAHDLRAAWNSGAEWILIDDARDTTIILGFAQEMRNQVKGVIEWAYFEETWTGNILLHHGR